MRRIKSFRLFESLDRILEVGTKLRFSGRDCEIVSHKSTMNNEIYYLIRYLDGSEEFIVPKDKRIEIISPLYERDDFYGDLEIEECEETISTIKDMLLELEDSEYDCLVELTPYQWSKKRSWSPEITITINKVGKMTDEEKIDFDGVILSILQFSTSQGYKYQVASGYNRELFLTWTIELFKADL